MQDSALSHAFPQAGSTETQKLGVCRLFDLEPDLDMPNPKEEELCLAFGRLHKLFEGKSTLKISAEIQEKVEPPGAVFSVFSTCHIN